MSRIQVGVLGLTHDHVWGNLHDLVASEAGELVAAADPTPELLAKIQDEYGCEQTFDTSQSFFDAVDSGVLALDAVYVFGDNASGAVLAATAAEHGLHVLVEKPMAADLSGAVEMVAAARQAGTLLMVNWPFAWRPGLQKAIAMVQAGEIGRLHSTKYRAAHAGPKELGCTPYFYEWLHQADLNGAGALMDYACYGAALARYMLGQPSRVTGVVGHLEKDYVTVDDNAVIVMQWSRAMAVTEASWTQIGDLTSYVSVFYGTEGTIVVEQGGRVLHATREAPEGVEVDVPALPAEKQSATAYFLSCISQGQPIEGLCSAEVGRDAQEILQAGLLSAINGEAVSLPLSVY